MVQVDYNSVNFVMVQVDFDSVNFCVYYSYIHVIIAFFLSFIT